jgi:hypothetical protein
MIDLIDAASEAMKQVDRAKAALLTIHTGENLAAINSAIARETSLPAREILSLARNALMLSRELALNLGLAPEFVRTVIKEQEHFLKHAAKNKTIALYQRWRRAEARDEKAATTVVFAPAEPDVVAATTAPSTEFTQYDTNFIAPDDNARTGITVAATIDPRKTTAELVAEGHTVRQIEAMAKANREAKTNEMPEPYPQLYRAVRAAGAGEGYFDEEPKPKAKAEQQAESYPGETRPDRLYNPAAPNFSEL